MPGNTLENMIDDMIRHAEQHPTHGVGCYCMDQHAFTLRQLFRDKGLTHTSTNLDVPPAKRKAYENLLVLFSYIIHNP